MLRELRLAGLKAFENFRVNFAERTILVGANSAGKSTLISAKSAGPGTGFKSGFSYSSTSSGYVMQGSSCLMSRTFICILTCSGAWFG